MIKSVLLIFAMLVLSMSLVMANEPNENACFGQLISEIAQENGGMGQYFGEMNGQDIKYLIKFIKEEVCSGQFQ